ncbi:unnamed protein product [Amoebophrya sp. A120]|nr:unnamed protein product [Amoebophrya sp. A120]|eukprot:GSA120T00000118001.1
MARSGDRPRWKTWSLGCARQSCRLFSAALVGVLLSFTSTNVSAVAFLAKQPVQEPALTKSFQLPENPPVSESNELPTQKIYLHQLMNCDDRGAEFTSGGNAFYQDFQPYIHNTHSVTICGQSTFWYYSTPDMDQRAILGGIRRCEQDNAVKSTDSCTCYDLPQAQGNLVESFTVEYC